jgi:hypothetical protein
MIDKAPFVEIAGDILPPDDGGVDYVPAPTTEAEEAEFVDFVSNLHSAYDAVISDPTSTVAVLERTRDEAAQDVRAGFITPDVLSSYDLAIERCKQTDVYLGLIDNEEAAPVLRGFIDLAEADLKAGLITEQQRDAVASAVHSRIRTLAIIAKQAERSDEGPDSRQRQMNDY